MHADLTASPCDSVDDLHFRLAPSYGAIWALLWQVVEQEDHAANEG